MQKRLEDLKRVAVMNPTDANLTAYMRYQRMVMNKSEHFAERWQRLVWTVPDLDYGLSGRPTNAMAINVFDEQQRDRQAQTTQRIPVTEIKPLLVLAAERGAAHGVLTGPGADYMRRRFDATTPIEIDVQTLHALPQPGCTRLEVTTRQRDVLEQGKRADQELRWQVSFCRDGSFPEKR